MNFQVLKQYFSFLVQAESTLQKNRQNLDLSKNSSSSFYHLIATRSQPEIDAQLMTNFIRNFTYNFQERPMNALVGNINYQLVPQDSSSQQTLMAKGIDLFLQKWSPNGKIIFADFTFFIKGQEDQPQKAKEVAFPIKKKFYQMIEEEIQHLLDSQTIRKTVALTYRNKQDLFELLSHDNQITIQQIKNIFLMSGDRRDEDFFDQLSRRFDLPCDYTQFRNWFSVTQSASKYKQQTRIFYSSIKRKKEDDRFNTPSGKTAAAIASSTKMTKGDRLLQSVQLDKPEMSRITFEEGASSHTNTAILGEILMEEERLNELKRQLIYRQDYDLELIYQRKGKLFEDILNRRYGTCNFTSFVRYVIPQDFEQRYLAFIKYQRQNTLSPETSGMIDALLEEEHAKQDNIRQRWEHLDREVVFRSYCNPGAKKISNIEMKKYFTERQCKILGDRLDPHRSGFIGYENFH